MRDDYCRCDKPEIEVEGGVWWCLKCEREVDAPEPDVDAIYEAEWEQKHEEELDQL